MRAHFSKNTALVSSISWVLISISPAVSQVAPDRVFERQGIISSAQGPDRTVSPTARGQGSPRQDLSRVVVEKGIVQASVATVKDPGDILIVEIAGTQYRVWSISPTGSDPVPVAQLVDVNRPPQLNGGGPWLTINVDRAKGAYLSVVGTAAPQVAVSVVGTMANNAPTAAYPATTPSGFTISGQGNGMSGPMPDAPVVYLRNDHAAMTGLTHGDATAMRGFHQLATAAALSMQQQLANEVESFLDMAGRKAATSTQQALNLQSRAIAFANLAGANNTNQPDFHIAKGFAELLQNQQQRDAAAIQQSAIAVTASIPDPKIVLSLCQGKVDALEGHVSDLTSAIEAAYPDDDELVDTIPESVGENIANNGPGGRKGNYGSERLEAEVGALEQCEIEALASYAAIDESTAPIPVIHDANYETISNDAETFGAQIEASSEQFAIGMNADSLDASFSIDPQSFLAFERQMLATLRSIDTTGAVADELNGLTLSSLPHVLAEPQARLGSIGGNTSVLSLGQCLASNFSFNIIGAGFVLGTPWNDRLTGSPSVDVLVGLKGNDCIKGEGGIDLAFGLSGDDIISGGDGHDFLFGNKGDDIIEGGEGKAYTFSIGTVTFKAWLGNLLDGGAGSDKIFGIADGKSADPGYTDIIFGDGLAASSLAGNDKIDGQGGINFAFGQTGNDTVGSNGNGKIEVNGTAVPMGSFLFGNSGNDTFSGSKNMDFAFGGAGNDSGGMGDGFDFAFGGSGNDSLRGDEGFDVMFGNTGNDRLEGGLGAGTGSVPLDVELLFGGPGNDTLLDKGGLGALAFGFTEDDIVRAGSGINLLFGGKGNDLVVGGRDTDLVFGAPGKDTVDGDMGVDLVFGGPDPDRVNGGGGLIDLISGGAGKDIVLGGSDITTVVGKDGSDIAFGNFDNDYVDGQDGIDLVFGDDGDDVVHGGNGVDFASGLAGNDCVYGDNDPDLVFGGDGEDKVWGGNGIDLVVGNAGIDDLYGDADSDLVISDGESEKIDLGGGAFNFGIGGGGNDDIYGLDGGIALGGAGDDRIQFAGSISIAFGGEGFDDLTVPNYSVALGGDGNDRLSGGALGFGGNGDDSIADARIAFGGEGVDRIQTKSGHAIAFGGAGDDKISQTIGGDVIFGNEGADNIKAADENNFVFGNGGQDTINVKASTPDPRDFAFGGGSGNSTYRNDTNKKDVRTGGGTSTPPAAPTPPVAPTGAVQAVRVCRLPATPKAFAASVRGGVGSGLILTTELRDYSSSATSEPGQLGRGAARANRR